MPIQQVMDQTGHSEFPFDAKNAASVTEAEQRFKELIGKGFRAFERLDNGDTQRALKFNPTAETTLFIPPLVGGPIVAGMSAGWPEPIEPHKPPTTTIAQRIAIARLKQNLSQAALAAKIGVTRGAVGQWETGATEPSGANLRRVATETETPFEWLATGREAVEYIPPNLWVPDPLAIATLMGGLELAGAVETGVFRAPVLELEKVKRAPISPDFRYAKASQRIWQVRGDGMNLEGIEDGAYVVATPLEEFKKRYGPLKEGSLVIVQRWRMAGDAAEREFSIR